MFKMVDMAKAPQEAKADSPVSMPMADQPRYPWGLAISLSEDELEKLDLEADCEVGDMIHLFCMAKVTSVSKNETQSGTSCRVELQITHMAAEDEDEENEEAINSNPHNLGKRNPYKNG